MSNHTNGETEKTPIEPLEPHLEPEYVGAYSDVEWDECTHVEGEHVEDLEFCNADATHTVVERNPSGELCRLPMCDEHGAPEDAERSDPR